ncbi:MAG: ABC transporter permease [Chloroflexota bacterium]
MTEVVSPVDLPVAAVVKRRSFILDVLTRLVKEKPLGTVGGIITLILLLVGIFANFLAPFGYNEIDLASRLSPPSAHHVLGADNLGRDLLSRIIYGARISMYVGLAGSLLSVMIEMTIGILSGFFGGKLDLTVQRFVDAFQSIPPLFFYLTIMAVLGPGLIQVIFVLGMVHGIRQSRVARSATIGIMGNVYIEAARAIGATNSRILLKHILPNVVAVIMVAFTVTIGFMIISEATLSFLGFGIPPPIPSWGSMLSESGRRYMLLAPWMALWPGLALAIVVYGINMLGDAFRDILDPRLRGGLGRYSGTKKRQPDKL